MAVRDKLNMRARLRSLNEDLSNSRNALSGTLTEHKTLEDELTHCLKQHQNLKSWHTDATREMLQVRGQLGVSKEERSELHKHSSTVHEENQVLDSHRINVFEEIYRLRGRVSGSQAKTLEKQKELSKLVTERKKLDADGDVAESALNVLLDKVEEAKVAKQEAQARYTDLMKWKVQSESELGQLDRDRAQLREKYGVASYEIKNREGTLGKRGQENKQLLRDLSRIEDQNKSLQNRALLAEKQQTELLARVHSAEQARQELHAKMGAAVMIDPSTAIGRDNIELDMFEAASRTTTRSPHGVYFNPEVEDMGGSPKTFFFKRVEDGQGSDRVEVGSDEGSSRPSASSSGSSRSSGTNSSGSSRSSRPVARGKAKP